MKHLPWRECGWALLFLLALAGLYMGAYYATITPRPRLVSKRYGIGVIGGKTFPVCVPGYHFLPEAWVSPVFAPMHNLDRQLRPETWSRERARELLYEEFRRDNER